MATRHHSLGVTASSFIPTIKGGWDGQHEVFYNDMGQPTGCTVEPMTGAYESVSDLRKSLELMVKDAKRKMPILKYDDFGRGGKHAKNKL